MAYANQPGLRPTSFGDAAAAATDAQVKKLTLTPKQAPVAGNAMQQAFSAAEAGGGRMPTTVQAPNWTIDNARPVNPVQYTGGGQVPQPGNWSTAPGAANTGGLRVAGPGLAERQTIRVPPNASMGTAPHAAPATPNLPATIQGQGPTFQGNGANPNFTTPGASSPYNAQQAKFDADTVQRARDAATRRAAGGGYAGVNQGSGAGVQGGVGGAQPVARPGTIDLHGSNAGQGGGRITALSNKAGNLTGRALRAVGPAAKLASGVGTVVAVTDNFNDYKLNDPDVDSSATGTFNALAQGDFSGAGRSLSKGALEAGMDLGSFAANTADIFVPGQPFSQGYNKTLRNHFGDQLTDNSGNNPDAAAPVASPPAAAPLQASYSNEGRNYPRGAAPREQSVGQSDRDLDLQNPMSNASLAKLNPNGKVAVSIGKDGSLTYSGGNVSGDVSFTDANGSPLRGQGGGGFVNIGGGGAAAQQAAASLQNPDGSKWSAQDNAVMAANIRDGVDPYRGTSRGGRGQASAGQQFLDQAEARLGVPLSKIASKSLFGSIMQGAQQAQSQSDTNATTRAGNEAKNATDRERMMVTSGDNRYQADATLRVKDRELAIAQQMRQRMADIVKAAGGDMNKAQQIATAYGLDGKTFGDVADEQQARSTKAHEQTKELLAPVSTVRGKDGQLEVSEAEQAKSAALVRNMVPGYEQMNPESRVAATRDVIPAVNLVKGANGLRNNSIWHQVPAALGGRAENPEMSSLPKFKSPLTEVGAWEGATTFGGVGAGDYKATTTDGKIMYFPRSAAGERELALLRERGAPLGK